MSTTTPSTTTARKPTFVLGVGCQKGGTTWLHAYLAGLPECDFGHFKEYHVLDVHYFPYNFRFRKRQEALLRRKLRVLKELPAVEKPRSRPQLAKTIARVDFHNNLRSYFDYFAMLAARRKEVHVVGDITPAYALLPQEALLRARKAMIPRGFDVKVIFLMRDPIERLHSAARMNVRDRGHDGESDVPPDVAVFEKLLSDDTQMGRSNYEMTITNLEAVFPVEDIHYAFYEDLFNETSIKKVTDFLGITYEKPDFDARLNTTEKTSDLPIELLETARRELAPVYDFVQARFPDVDLKTLWQHA